MLNQVAIIGRLTRDPELIYTPDGIAIANFCIASQRDFKNAEGKYDADFIDCLQFKKGAENTANLARKGSLVSATGRIQKRNYENSEGKKVYVTEVVVKSLTILDNKNSSGGSSSAPPPPVPDDYKNFDLDE